jgi:hypothetical protein
MRSSGSHGALYNGSECVGQVAAEQLLDQVEGIEKGTVLDDAPRAQREEFRKVELHQALIIALLHEEALHGGDLQSIDGDECQL